MNFIKQLAALVLRISHAGISLFILFGWLLPWSLALKIHMILVPLVIVQWAVNDDKCVLTQLEHVLKGTGSKNEDEKEEGFVESFLKLCMDRVPGPKQLKFAIWSVTGCCWLAGVGRFFLLGHGHSGA